jgi:hypothetical protein
MAVSSPLIGIQGQGDVALTGDNQLNLNVVATPLGDWKKDVDKTGIPGIGLFGQAVGGAQKAMNSVSRQVLLSFQVTGPAANPSIQPVAAPALTGAAKDIFSTMGHAGGGLMDLVDPKTK